MKTLAIAVILAGLMGCDRGERTTPVQCAAYCKQIPAREGVVLLSLWETDSGEFGGTKCRCEEMQIR